ncbi:MAG TPA: dockerin type I domain-containing protein, partial [Phycisphaerae bacterium]
GNCYKIRIGGAPGASGTGSLSLSIPPAPVLIVSANPPTDNPFVAGAQPYRDVLQTGPAGALAQGIGGPATPVESAVSYSPILVTFNLPPCPMPAPSTISISCTGGGAYPCPMIASVAGTGTNYQIMLTSSANGVIPPGGCTTLTFAGAFPGQKLQYQSLPGDMDMNGMVTTQDLLALVHALQDGSAQIDVNVPRYDANRSGVVDTTDLLRLVQLLNGTNAPQAFAGLTVAACP